MRCSILGLTPAQIDGLVATPALVSYLTIWDRKAHFDEVIRRLPPEHRQRAEEARERIARLGSFEPPLNLEKWWHSLHHFLTGEIGPAGGAGGLLLTGGREVGEDMGYGPARLYNPAETKDFRHSLETQDLANLQARIGEMSRLAVYPGRGTRVHPRVGAVAVTVPTNAEHQDTLRNNVGRHFVRLRDYVHEMSDRGNGLLVWIV
jgi:hypothetical protein